MILLSCGIFANTIRLLAPLTIPEEQLEEGLDILEQCLTQVYFTLKLPETGYCFVRMIFNEQKKSSFVRRREKQVQKKLLTICRFPLNCRGQS